MTEEFKTFLTENGYQMVRDIPGNRCVSLFKYMFTWAIIVGKDEDRTGIEDRWCYADAAGAVIALEGFDWSTYVPNQVEPQGWKRHPFTGRRRGPEYEMQLALGNNTEYVNI